MVSTKSKYQELSLPKPSTVVEDPEALYTQTGSLVPRDNRKSPNPSLNNLKVVIIYHVRVFCLS